MELNLGNNPPIFAHEVAISTFFRTQKTKQGKLKKESFTELIFIDAVKKRAISRIVIPFGTLKALPRIIDQNIKKIREELKSKELPKKIKLETESTNRSYFG